jgi:hypothetical protein
MIYLDGVKGLKAKTAWDGGFVWRCPHGDSNPGYSLERAVS